MRRIRIVFTLLALALFAATGLLVQRALGDVAAERAARRETLALRVFDELERALSGFLVDAESVPFGDWLAQAPGEPSFVSARFELDPDGRLRLSPGASPEIARAVAAWQERRRDAAGGVRPRAPGPKRSQDERPLAAAAPPSAKESVYDTLQSLNRAAESRVERQAKLESERDAKLGRAREKAFVHENAPGAARADAGVAPAPAPMAPRDRADSGQPSPAILPLDPALGVAVDPLHGDALGPGTILLARTVIAGGRGHRQGLVVSIPALAAWLRNEVLPGDRLPGVELALYDAGSGAEAGAFVHRFVEPFDALDAVLTLPPIDAGAPADTLVALSLLLAAAGAAGLFAVYRMVAVALRFAEQRSNFVAAVSHELKTPLTSIRMYGEMLRDGLVPGEAKKQEYYETITAESERLSRLIDNVLAFARSERREGAALPAAAPLGPEVLRLAEVLRPHAAAAGFDLAVAVEPDLPAVRLDRDALAQVLVNLVDNALKYAREARVRDVRVSCVRDGGDVVLRVRDHGPGVPEAELGRVFELFHRGGDELTRATRGTGLGLALVRSLAARMGARTSARNAPDGGFEVTVSFPATTVG